MIGLLILDKEIKYDIIRTRRTNSIILMESKYDSVVHFVLYKKSRNYYLIRNYLKNGQPNNSITDTYVSDDGIKQLKKIQ